MKNDNNCSTCKWFFKYSPDAIETCMKGHGYHKYISGDNFSCLDYEKKMQITVKKVNEKVEFLLNFY